MQTPVKAGIIGFGLSGQVFHAPFLHAHPGFEIKKIVERSGESSKEKYPYVTVVKNYRRLLDDPGIDLVVHCTPNIYHYEYVKESLLAGKHVVVEKPFTPTTDEADKLIDLANKKGLKIFVYHNRRWDGDFLTVKKLIDQGSLGRVNYYEAHFDRFSPQRTRAAWRDEKLPGSGNLYDLGSHLIDQALCLFGTPQTVFADVQSQRQFGFVDDYFRVVLQYQHLEAVLTAGMLVREHSLRYIVKGTGGTFGKHGIDPQEERLKNGASPGDKELGQENPEFFGTLTTGDDRYGKTERIPTEPGNYMAFYQNVYDVLVNNKPMAVKPEEARNVIRVIELAFQSNLTGQVIKADFT
jgi:scyllo-inositol 2-dehydrogenase (NADP+)